ncbi:MAG TPA: hypothetical protein VFG51_02560 [Candidatus Saccharimonadia bacterium]|nr:hypothetical protein [Candidatus Saccharimonadia bacterium]
MTLQNPRSAVLALLTMLVSATALFLFYSQGNTTTSSGLGMDPFLRTALNDAPKQVAPCSEYVPESRLNVSPTNDKWCTIRVSYDTQTKNAGYRLEFPNTWNPSIRGADGMSLSLDVDGNDYVFISAPNSTASINNYDSITTSFESRVRIPVISPNETKLEKRVITKNDRQMLYLVTKLDQIEYTYFIFDNGLSGKDKTVYFVRFSPEVTQDQRDAILSSFAPVMQ